MKLRFYPDCAAAQEELTLWAEQERMLLGGEPLLHPTVIVVEFCCRQGRRFEQAVNDWNNQHPRFGTIDLRGTELSRLTAPAIPATKDNSV